MTYRIPENYEAEMTFNEAAERITRYGRGDMLEGMNALDRRYEEYLAEDRAYANGEIDEKVYGDDDDFFLHWGYEYSAYNVVYENMGKLFERV